LGPIIVNIIYIIIICSYNITITGKLIKKQNKINILYELSKIIDNYIQSYSKIALFRNFIFATITEELVFRALMIPVLYKSLVLESNYSSFHIILICPIFFGLAHIHHCIEEIRNGTKISTAAIKTLIQITYTSIFGFIAALLFMRTGNFISPLIAHIICNFYGLPDLGFTMPISDKLSFMYSYRYFLLFLHAFGLILFGSTVMIATEKISKSSFYW
jgi:prenyl protein peptidase